ncbi:hypothetical protein BE18_03595, partial [Sorangium cellulosum]
MQSTRGGAGPPPGARPREWGSAALARRGPRTPRRAEPERLSGRARAVVARARARYARTMERAPVSWVIDPDDPRAPPQEIWDRMTPEERQRVVDALPSEFEISEASPPEGDFHFNAKLAARDTLGGHFQSIGKRVYLACELPVYYPAGRMVAPDLIAVRDVEVKERACWSVSAEGKGIDLAMEILWNERSQEELENLAARYASLGIPEYFVFDRRRRRLRGFRLAQGSARYEPIARKGGLLASAVLDLDLGLEGDRLCFYHALAR